MNICSHIDIVNIIISISNIIFIDKDKKMSYKYINLSLV